MFQSSAELCFQSFDLLLCFRNPTFELFPLWIGNLMLPLLFLSTVFNNLLDRVMLLKVFEGVLLPPP